MAVYDLMRWGPTESNITPARFHFVVSKEAKARLEPLLDEGNRKTDHGGARHRHHRL